MKKLKRAITLVLAFAFIFLLSSCGAEGQLENYRPITSIDDFDGRRIGCIVGWEADYLLSDRDDLTLMRYDSLSDMVLALSYKQLDGIAVDEDNAKLVFNSVTGIKLYDEPIAYIGYTALTIKEEKNSEFNSWLAEFKKTDEYKEYEERNHAFDGANYVNMDIEEVENPTETLVIGYVPLYYPCAFKDKNGYVTGLDLEIMRYFARDMGYGLEFIEISESAIGEYLEKSDFLIGGLTDVYREDYELNPNMHMTDAIREIYVKVIEVSDWDNLKIKSAIVE